MNPLNPTTPAASPVALGDDAAWLNSMPKIRCDLRFEIRRIENQVHYVIEDPSRNKFFEIGTEEFDFIQFLDGKTTVDQAIQKNNKVAEHNALDQSTAQRIVLWLTQSCLVQSDCAATTERIIKARRMRKSRKWMTFVNPITFKIPLFNPDKMLATLLPFSRWIFGKPFLLVWVITCFYACIKISENYEGMANASIGVLASGRWIWLLIGWVALKVIHEMGHGLACKHFGGRATETGVLMLLFTPLAYIDVSSSWRLTDKTKRIIISAAGMYVEIFVAAIAIIIWSNTSSKFVADICFNLFLIAGVTTVLFNANPLMRFDGYYMLTDTLGITNLYTRGQQQFSSLFKKLIGMPQDKLVPLDRKGWILLVYGFLSFFWRISISISLIIGASALFGGFGLIFGLMGAIVWFGIPLTRSLKSFWTTIRQQQLNRQRFFTAVGIASLFCLTAFTWLRAPVIKSAPAIVRFKEESVLRSGASGFLNEVHIANGQFVEQGDVLFVLDNPQIHSEVEKLKLEIEQSKIQSRVLRQQNKYAESQMEYENLRSLKQQLMEKEKECESLRIIAPFDGIVFARDLINQIGIFYKRGDAVATLAQSSNKEIEISFEQTELEGVESNISQQVRLCFSGVPLIGCQLDSINPRASNRPVDPSLTAAYGGYLSVQPVTDKNDPDPTQLKLLEHHFSATVRLDEEQSQMLESGQRGFAYYRTTRQSLGVFLYVESRQWLRARLEQLTAHRGF